MKSPTRFDPSVGVGHLKQRTGGADPGAHAVVDLSRPAREEIELRWWLTLRGRSS
jgi:hypothetical protein